MITLYTKTDCNFCDTAKQLLRDRQLPFVELKLNEDFTRESLLEQYHHATHYPVVVVDGYHIGGASELRTLLLRKDLQHGNQKLLNEGI